MKTKTKLIKLSLIFDHYQKWDKFIKFWVLLHPKQRYKCRDCNKQFVLNPERHISEEKKAIIDKLLLEKISLRGIARSVGVSGVWGWSSTPSLQK